MDGDRRTGSLIGAACVALGVLGLAYLLFKSFEVLGDPGFDFKYLWTAGKVWAEGGSPDDAAFHAMASRYVTEGRVPEVWSYPPNWWAICTGLAQMPMAAAHAVWNVAGVGLIAGASLLLAFAVRPARSSIAVVDASLQRPWAIAGLHLFLMAGFEATAILITVGQTTAPVYFGIAALLFGMVRGKRWWAVAGLALTFLKPQIGVIFATVMLFHGKEARLQLLWAIVVSAALAIPALITDYRIIGVFLDNAGGHKGIMAANLPGAMTGLRHLTGVGTMGALALTLAAAVGLMRLARAPNEAMRAWQMVVLTTAAIVALAPLHFYDLVLAGVVAFGVGAARMLLRVVGIVGLLLMVRADQVGTMTGLYDKSVPIFEGSLLSTIGALMMLAAAISAAMRWNKGSAT